MRYSHKVAPPLVGGGVAMVAFNSFAIVMLLADHGVSRAKLFSSIWPIVLVSAIAVLLLMSFLYRAMRQVIAELDVEKNAALHQALHDHLTGLPNRILLNDRIEQALGRCARSGEKAALLMLDLDRFKDVNDTLGHPAGDLLVQKVAGRLRELVRVTDTVARLGGDEFAIIQSAPGSVSDVRVLCDKILTVIREPFDLDGPQARVGVSIGAVLVENPVPEAADLLRRADITLYQAKAAGRDCYRMFSAQMDRDVQRRHQIEERLRRAIKTDSGLDVHFQPQLDRCNEVIGVEALLRWTDDVLGTIAPAEIIQIAEESGLIDAVGEFVLKRACAAARRWPHLSVAINVSPLQFRDPNFAKKLIDTVAREGVGPPQIELEITENLLLEHGDLCAATLRALRRDGFRIALDDFGTGYSSLSYLRHFRVDKIKLDRSFIDDAAAQESLAIVRAAVSLGHAMGLTVVAEGISNEAQESIAEQAGCDGFQGFLYAPAVREGELDGMMRQKWQVGKAA